MATYTVKNGENLYDIALKLFGGVEGVFNLLVCNQDAIKEEGLSLEQTIEAGTVLNYTDSNVINKDVVDGIVKGGGSVKNGEHLYNYYFPDLYISSYVKKFNVEVAEKSLQLWPDIGSSQDQREISDYLAYLNNNCVWTETFEAADIADLVGGDYTKAENITMPERIKIPKMIVKQKGMESSITFRMKPDSVMMIDWGDTQPYDMCLISDLTTVVEHCYEDEGDHVITIYGDFSFSRLDLTGIGGVYYPLAEINVNGDFTSPFPGNSIINELIIVT